MPAIRLRQPVTELCAMRICRQCSDAADVAGFNQYLKQYRGLLNVEREAVNSI